MTLTVWVKRLIVVKVSEETIRNILCRDSLIADEFVKFQVGDFKTNNSFNPMGGGQGRPIRGQSIIRSISQIMPTITWYWGPKVLAQSAQHIWPKVPFGCV